MVMATGLSSYTVSGTVQLMVACPVLSPCSIVKVAAEPETSISEPFSIVGPSHTHAAPPGCLVTGFRGGRTGAPVGRVEPEGLCAVRVGILMASNLFRRCRMLSRRL